MSVVVAAGWMADWRMRGRGRGGVGVVESGAGEVAVIWVGAREWVGGIVGVWEGYGRVFE